MPAAIPLVASAFSVGAGVAAAGGLAGIAAGGLTLTSGLMIAGGVLSGLGTLTGNAKLARIGAVASLVGGAGQALGIGANAATAATAPSTATAGSTIGDALAKGTLGAELAGAAPAAEAASAGAGLFDSAGAATSVFDTATNPFLAGNEALLGTGPSLSATGTGAAAAELANSPLGLMPPAGAETARSGGILGRIGDVGDWIENNPNQAKLVGGLIEGAAGPYLQKQKLKAELDARKSYDDWARQRYSDSVRNLVIPSMFAPAPVGGIIGGQRG